MRSKSFTLLASLIAAVFLFSSLSVAGAQEENQEERASVDLADLNLEVTETEVVDEITNEDGDTLTAEEGRKLVIVTLEGEAREAGTLNAPPEGFTASDSDEAEEQSTFRNFPSAAVMTDDAWVIGATALDEDTVETPTAKIDEAGSVTIKVAFIVDEDVAGLDILVPAETTGQAIVTETAPDDADENTTE